MKRIKDLSSKEIYSIFFEALKNKSGKIITTKINGEKKLVFILNKNPFDQKLILDLESLSVYHIRTFFGRIMSIDQILDIENTREGQKGDRLKEELEKISDIISDDLKEKFIEKLKAKKHEAKKKRVAHEKKEFKKIKPKRPMARRSVAK
jgi:hypothetical protein